MILKLIYKTSIIQFLMKTMLGCLLLTLVLLQAKEECPIAQYYQFVLKDIDQAFPNIDNPYHNPSQ